jgi:hypothetical protein
MGIKTDDWSFARRLVFHFAFVYLILYIFPFPLQYIPYANLAFVPYRELWDWLVPWVGRNLLGLEITVRPNGSGDTTYNYVQVLCFLAIAAAAAGVWTLLDRRRAGHVRLGNWLRIYVRFYLASTMLSYGAVKVIKSQFPSPALDRLVQPFGDASPMGLLWTFMGASQGYNVFSGGGEMLGGLLLTARRTTLVGALVCVGVLSNVVMLNFCYDVPVKLFSAHLLLMALFLTAPDLRRLANLFLFNRRVEPAEIPTLFGPWWLRGAAVVLRTLVVVGYTAMVLYGAHQSRRIYGDSAPRSALYGIWDVEEYMVDGKLRPALVTDTTRWRRVIFDYPQTIAIQAMSDSRSRYMLAMDEDNNTLTLTKRDDPAWKSEFAFERAEVGMLTLEGTFAGSKVRVRLRRTGADSFLLMNRGFHWINEYPFNR